MATGFGRITQKSKGNGTQYAQADTESDDKPMGMVSRFKKELEDNDRAISGTGTGPGGGEDPANEEDTYIGLDGKRHKKGGRE